MRESLGISCDIPVSINKIEEEYKSLIPNIDFSNFDLIEDKVHYFLYNIDELSENSSQKLNKDSIKWEVLSKLETKVDDPLETNAYDLMIEICKRAYPKCLESIWNVNDRWERVKKYIKNYLQQNEIPDDQKVILCSHYFFLYNNYKYKLLIILSYVYTGKWDREYSREEELPLPTQQLKLKNCEFLADPNHYS